MKTQRNRKRIFNIISAIVGVAVVAMILLMKGCGSIDSMVKTEVAKQVEMAHSGQTEVISEADIEGLPEPAQRYLRYAGVVGKPHIRFVRMKWEGFFRRKQNQKWAPLKAEVSYTTDPPSLVFHARVGDSFLGRATIREKYMDGKGHLLLKIWPGITVVDNTGETTVFDQADRFLNEMVWFPTAFVKPYNHWEAIDANSAKVTMSYQGVTVSATVYINEKGEMVKFVGQKHVGVDGNLGGKEQMLVGWTVNLGDYEERHGFRVPTSGDALFNLESGDFQYFKVTDIAELEYDPFSKN